MTPLLAQLRAELAMTLRRGESVLLALGIPVLLLVFFSAVDVLPTDTDRPVDFLAPGMLALAILSAAFTGPAIATAFERQYGVLKRIGTTPLGRPRLLAAKIVAIACVEVLQVALLVAIAAAFGWRPHAAGFPAVVAATQRAELVLAGANGLHIVLLLLSGMMIPLRRLPSPVRAVAELLPSTALADIIRGALDRSLEIPNRAWIVLIVWALIAPVLAAWRFRWE
jgi:ABC-2 type transport system permease protein